ncbi:bifunctional diguanylate cyclase/phosphodiesterase [Mycobacterium sp. MBM]|nr:bifunctional diguanylate cyclase/phosphodiesterase [Mycobacterium sp. MBM]
MSTIRTNLSYVAGMAIYLVFVCWLLAGWGGPQVTATVRSLGFVAFSGLTCACAVQAARAGRGSIRIGWIAIACGFLGWVVGASIWAYYELGVGTAPPFPSVADIGFLALPVAVGVVWVLRTAAGRLSTLRQLLDGTVIAAALFVLVCATVLHDVFSDSDFSTMHTTLIVVYPIAALTMVTMSTLVISVVPPGRRYILGWVTAGLVAIALGDITSHGAQMANVYPSSHFPVISKVTGLLMIAAAARMSVTQERSRAANDHRPLPTTIMWLPYAPMPFAMVAAVAHLWPNVDIRPELVGVTILVIAALIRQLTVLLENQRLLEEVARHAFHDPLTGLANRLLFTDRLDHAIALRRRSGRPVAVLSLDLDDFKLVNDNLGHHWGDALLCEIADRLVPSVPPGHTVARLGGDEFAIIIEADPQTPEEIATRVMHAFDAPFHLDGQEVYMRPSIGLAAAPGITEPPISSEELIKRADVAMYVAKRSRAGGVQVFAPGMQIGDVDTAPARDAGGQLNLPPASEIRLLGELRRMVDGGDLQLSYRPQIALATGHIVGVEALVRWPHPDLGVLAPHQFLPLIRRNGLMGAVTDLVLEQAARDAATWYRPGIREVPVAINLFAPSFNDATLPDRIAAVLAAHGLPMAAVTIEITEHYLLADVRQARHVIERLRAAGFRLSIDDFGSGYATMSYLRDLPIDELKLDPSFVAPMLLNPRAAAIVHSVIKLTHSLGIASVAEGVEDATTAELLRGYGCTVAQGDYFAEPVSTTALQAQLDVTAPDINQRRAAPPSAV